MDDLLKFILVAVFAGGGAYLGSYLKKKGENLATHEDVQQVVRQVSAVTQATKEIEAKISNEVWERQRAWEIKRDALFEVVRQLAAVQHAVNGVTSTFDASRKDPNHAQQAQKWNDLIIEKTQALTSAQLNFEQARILASLVWDSEIDVAFRKVQLSMAQIAVCSMTGDQSNAPDSSKVAIEISELIELVRKQIGMAL